MRTKRRRPLLASLLRELPCDDLAVDLLMAVGYTKRHALRTAQAVRSSMGDSE